MPLSRPLIGSRRRSARALAAARKARHSSTTDRDAARGPVQMKTPGESRRQPHIQRSRPRPTRMPYQHPQCRVAWSTALMRPDVVRGLWASVSRRRSVGRFLRCRRCASASAVSSLELLSGTRRRGRRAREGPAPHLPPRDVRALRRQSAQRPVGRAVVPPGNGFLDLFEDPEELPSWLAEADIDTLATEFTEAGFTSALNWYRNWQLTASWEGAQYRMPGRYVTVTWSTGSRGWTN